MNGWKISQHHGIFKVLLAAILVLSITAIPLPQISGWWQGTAEAAPPDKTPEGQLKRRGIVGIVLSVGPLTATSTTPSASSTPPAIDPNATSTLPTIPPTGHVMIVGMQHGDVKVIVPDGVRIHAPQQDGISLMDIVGMKVAVLTDKPPVDPNADDDDDLVIRTVTAKKVMIVPSEAIRTHGRGLVTAAGAKGKGKGKFKLLGDNGEEQEIEIDDEDGLEEGDDVIFIKPKKGHKNASSTPLSLNVHGLRMADHIADRLAKFTDRLTAASDSPAAAKLLSKIEKFQASVDKRLDKLEKDIKRLESKGKKISPKVHDKLKVRKTGDEDGEDRPGKGRKPNSLTTDADSDGEGNEPARGKGKPKLHTAPSGDDTDGQSTNRGKGKAPKPQPKHTVIDCDDYTDADHADIPRECQEKKKPARGGSKDTTSTSSNSGKGNGGGQAIPPGRGKRN